MRASYFSCARSIDCSSGLGQSTGLAGSLPGRGGLLARSGRALRSAPAVPPVLQSPHRRHGRCGGRPASMRVRLAVSAGSIFGIAARAPSRSSIRLKYCSRSALLERLQRQAVVFGADLAQCVERALIDSRPRHADIDQGADRRLARATLGDTRLEFGDALLDESDALRGHARPWPRRLVCARPSPPWPA